MILKAGIYFRRQLHTDFCYDDRISPRAIQTDFNHFYYQYKFPIDNSEDAENHYLINLFGSASSFEHPESIIPNLRLTDGILIVTDSFESAISM